MNKDIVKKFNLSKEQRDVLQNIEIGLINAEATSQGLFFYKNGFLQEAYKKLGINPIAKKGFKKNVSYSLSDGVVTVTETPEVKK